MGLAIDRTTFTSADFKNYRQRVAENLQVLRVLMSDPQFAVGPQTIGAELELSMVDEEGHAFPHNQEVLEASNNEHTQVELDNFNLEYNFTPTDLVGAPFADLQNQISFAMSSLDSFARRFAGRIVSVGILPTLRHTDLTVESITDLPRYHALAAGLRAMKGEPFDIDIHGVENLKLFSETIAFEGANTSFQLHLRVNPDKFAQTFNAAQFVTPLALACAANSPVFLNKLLWDETRVSLFKQATDTRIAVDRPWRRAARVPFGHGWVRSGALELFEEAVALHPPLLPLLDAVRAPEQLQHGEIPSLRELRLLQGTVWQWNRPVYDPGCGGHLRIELRALPAGPTPLDMAANAAFLYGLVLYYRDRIDTLMPALPFRYAEYNFYRAAQKGLDAKLLWPDLEELSPREIPIRTLIDLVLPHALSGLTDNGVDSADANRMMDVIANRNASGVTGARWQRRELLSICDSGCEREQALVKMLKSYMAHQAAGEPVGSWPQDS
ncbi:MAG: glutamate--cysteine ligase [Gammaproteobacteria bacterium]|nr:glutamate--cysteine ligase [Gammaproteobacteria bacterium]